MKRISKHNIIGLKQLRDNTEAYIRDVQKGKSFLVMRRSIPIFKIAPADEWGDEGMWETILDFSTTKKGSMSARDFLKEIDIFHESHPKIPQKARS